MFKSARLILSALWLTSCALFGGTAPQSPTPDAVLFKNGDTLTGTIVRATSATVSFSNPAVGNLTLKWSDIKSLKFQHEIRITSGREAARSFHAATGSAAGTPSAAGLDLFATEVGETTAVTIREVQEITGLDRCASGIQSACPQWQLQTLKISTAFLTSTQHQQTYGGEILLLRPWRPEDAGWPRQRTLIDLLPTYDEKRKNSLPGSANITQDYFGRFQHLLFLTGDRFYASTTADLFRDNSLGIYFQQSYGAGVGTLQNGLELDADLRFIGEHFYGSTPSVGLVGTELSERYTFGLNWIRPGTTLTEAGFFIPVFNQSRAWQGRGRVDLLVPITPELGFSTTLIDNYVENAPPAFRKNYLRTTVGLAFSLTAKK